MADIDPTADDAQSASTIASMPLPAHGFEVLDELADGGPATASAVEVISRAAVILMNAAAESLGLASVGEPNIDLDEARRLITSLAGLVAASQGFLGIHRQPLRDGVRTLQAAFREASSYPDEPGEGPGEDLLH